MDLTDFFASFFRDRLAVTLFSYGMIAYAAIKGVGYSFWCDAGQQIASPLMPTPQRRRRAILFGLVRLLIGMALGIVLGPIFLLLWGYGIAGYVLLYVPVRWFEWGLMELLLSEPSRSGRSFVLGRDAAWRRWRRRGIALSCLLDLSIPLGAILGLIATPGHGGRIFC